MPRIRTIKPEFWTDEKIVELSPLARLLFIGSWNYADDHGCLSPSSRQLKLRVIPTAIEDADKLVEELFDAGLLERMKTADGRDFWHVANWSKHQRVNRPSDSEYGDPTTWRKPPTRAFSEDSVNPHVVLSEHLVRTHGGKEGKGKEGNGTDVALRGETRNITWDTLTEIYGEPTPPQRSLYGRITKWLNDQDATPNDIRERAEAIVDKWGPHTNTITALEKWWNYFDSPAGQLTEANVDEYRKQQERARRLEEAERLDRALGAGE